MLPLFEGGALERSAPPVDIGSSLAAELSARFDRPVDVIWTRNRSTFLSLASRGDSLVVRLHRAFGSAPPEILKAVVVFVTGTRRSAANRRALTALRSYFEGTVRRRAGDAEDAGLGCFFDLREELRTVRHRWAPDLPASVFCSWSRWPAAQRRRRARRRSIQLGSFCQVEQRIRIHPVLDHPSVPGWFVRFVIFHEALHALHPPSARGTRRVVHSAEFRRVEASHPDCQRAEQWLEQHLDGLLERSARGPRTIGGRD